MHDTYLDEMAARLRVKSATLHYWAKQSFVPAIKDVRGRYLFDEREVLRLVADWPPTPPTSIRRRTTPLGSAANDHRPTNDNNHS